MMLCSYSRVKSHFICACALSVCHCGVQKHDSVYVCRVIWYPRYRHIRAYSDILCFLHPAAALKIVTLYKMLKLSISIWS